MSKQARTEQMVDIWRMLRRPFMLPRNSAHCHQCEWEAIDLDVLGCRLCGNIHACDVCTCKETFSTNDSVVCLISGIALRNLVFAEDEFVDTVALTGPINQFDEDIDASIECTVHSMFLSERSKREHRISFCEHVLRWSREALGVCPDLFAICVSKLNSAHKYAHIFQSVCPEQRRDMATLASRECRRVLHFMLRCGMPVKAVEVHRLTIGLLFLMKRGISHHSRVLLRKLPGIHILLPAENMLLRHYGIHPKFITETENRIKYCLRTIM